TASLGCNGRHFLSDVQPRQRRASAYEVDRLVRGVVRAHEQVGTGVAELLGGREEHPAHLVPVPGLDVTHVVGEGIRMQRDLWIRVASEDCGSLGADGSIAQRSAFRAHANDPDVLDHASPLHTPPSAWHPARIATLCPACTRATDW